MESRIASAVRDSCIFCLLVVCILPDLWHGLYSASGAITALQAVLRRKKNDGGCLSTAAIRNSNLKLNL